jgi:hypothetical protein
MLRRDWLILSLLTAAELTITGLLAYYCIVISAYCFLVMLTLIVLSAAQIVHVLLISLQFSIDSSHTKLHLGVTLFWSGLMTFSLVLLGLLPTSEDCDTDQDFNVAFAVCCAEALVGFFFTCCSMCNFPSAKKSSPSQSFDDEEMVGKCQVPVIDYS